MTRDELRTDLVQHGPCAHQKIYLWRDGPTYTWSTHREQVPPESTWVAWVLELPAATPEQWAPLAEEAIVSLDAR